SAQLGRPDAALVRRAVQIVQKSTNVTAYFSLEALSHLARLCDQLSQPEEIEVAELAWQCYVREVERSRGEDHADLLPGLDGWAGAACRLGRPDQEWALRKRRMSIAEKALPAQDPVLIECLRSFTDYCVRT